MTPHNTAFDGMADDHLVRLIQLTEVKIAFF